MTTCVVIPPTVADDLVFSMLVQSVACGDDGLRELLEAEAQTIWCMTADCRADIHYLQAQLGVIDYAMLYARNQIDLANSRENSYGESVSTATSVRDTEGTRSSAYNKCGWSSATSWQQFERNSAQHDRSSAADSVSSGQRGQRGDKLGSWPAGRAGLGGLLGQRAGDQRRNRNDAGTFLRCARQPVEQRNASLGRQRINRHRAFRYRIHPAVIRH
jgi:hypothetical protein